MDNSQKQTKELPKDELRLKNIEVFDLNSQLAKKLVEKFGSIENFSKTVDQKCQLYDTKGIAGTSIWYNPGNDEFKIEPFTFGVDKKSAPPYQLLLVFPIDHIKMCCKILGHDGHFDMRTIKWSTVYERFQTNHLPKTK